MKRRLCLVSASVITILSSAVQAADYTFDGGAGTIDWQTAQNWSADTLPSSADDATINAPSGVSILSAGAQASGVRISDDFSYNTGLTITGAGTLDADIIQVAILGTAYMNILNGGAVTFNALYVGQYSGANGTVTVGNGATLTGTDLRIGNGADSTGTLHITDGGVTNGSNLYMGANGTGHLLIDDGGIGNFGNVTIQRSPTEGGSSIVRGAGSQLNSSGTIVVASANFGSLLVEDGGVVNNASDTYMGLFGGSNGTLRVLSGGAYNANNFYLGQNVGSAGTAIISGAGSELTYSGSLRVGGSGTGVLTVSDGADVNGGSVINIAMSAGSSGTINIGAAAGDTAVAAGTLSVDEVLFGAGTGVLNFNHTSTNYNFAPDLTGAGTVNIISGGTALTGDNSAFTGTVDVSGGVLIINGALGGTINSSGAGSVRGTGTVSQLTVDNGGVAAPGNSIGTLNAVNVVFNPGSTYEVELNSLGQSDLINASGTATLNGGTVQIIPYPDYLLNYTYTILTATGGVTGAFDATSAPLLDAALTYDANNVYVTLSPSVAALMQIGRTPNQMAVAQAATRVPNANPAMAALFSTADAASAQRALDLLSGEIHASTTGALIQSQRQISDLVLKGEDFPKDGENRVWVKAFGGRSQTNGTFNTASLDQHGGGVMVGLEHGGDDSRYGFAVGAGETRLDQNTLSSKADINSIHAMIYGGRKLAKSGLTINGGVSASHHDIDTERNLDFGAFDQDSKTKYTAQTYQAFAEIARPVTVTSETKVTPYAQAAYTVQRSGSFKESGDAGLRSSGDTAQMVSSALGVRFAQKLQMNVLPEAVLSAGAGWQHNYGDQDSKRKFAFNDSEGEKFTVRGAPYDKDTLLLNAGLAFQMRDNAVLTLSYGAGLGRETQSHAFGATLNWKF
jgi:T5SS/PEP-CTERM-associated repeat protein